MRLLQKDAPFIWDATAQRSFDDLKHALMNTLLFHPPNYVKDYIIYLAASTSTMSMVLVQEDDDDTELVIYYLSKSLSSPELQFSPVEKLALAAVTVIQRFHHYIMLRTTTVIADSNPMYHILTLQVLGGKYLKWIVILQEFDLEFAKSKAKKSLVFTKLICDLPHTDENVEPIDSLLDESSFLVITSDPLYGNILLYLQTQRFQPGISRDERRRIRHHSKHYLIIGDTLYLHDIDIILRRCLTHQEVEQVLNDCHLRACGSHLSGMAIAQFFLRVDYFGLPYSKIALRPLKNSHPVRSFRRKHVPTQLHFIPLSLLAPLPNGVSISCNVSLP
jgi:hypothetical protein